MALRVKTNGDIKDKAVEFAREQIGQPYDLASIFLITKQDTTRNGWLRTESLAKKWYCSELVWAAYLNASNGSVDLEDVPDSGAITPTEIAIDDNVEMIGEHKEKPVLTVAPPFLVVKSHCPVDLSMINPENLTLNKRLNEIPKTAYEEADFDGDSDLDDWICVLEPKVGEYLIGVTAEIGAPPTGTYSLEATFGEETIVLARNIRIQDIPTNPYAIRLDEKGFGSVAAATVDYDPNAICLKGKIGWLAAYIEFSSHDINDLDVPSILLNNTIQVDLASPPAINDHDNDGILDLKVCFNRTTVSEYILSKNVMYGNITLTITGRLSNGTSFEGSSRLRVRMPGDINGDGLVELSDMFLAAEAYGSFSGHPRWNPAADENEDGMVDMIDLFFIGSNFGKKYQ
jgi:hypothetical protein